MAFRYGETVKLKVRRGRKVDEVLAVFQGYQSKVRAVVLVDPEKIDEDALKVVDVRSVLPYYDSPTDMQRRARHAARKFKMGVRAFRLDKPDGPSFWIETLDAEKSIAVGRLAGRKTIRIVPTHSLFPETR